MKRGEIHVIIDYEYGLPIGCIIKLTKGGPISVYYNKLSRRNGKTIKGLEYGAHYTSIRKATPKEISFRLTKLRVKNCKARDININNM